MRTVLPKLDVVETDFTSPIVHQQNARLDRYSRDI
jgi:hypothetical protein